MLTFTSEQMAAWMAAFIFPLARILAFIASSPIFGNKQVSVRIKIGLSLVLTFVIAPTLQIPSDIRPGTMTGMLVLVEQILAGIAMGFTMRVVFAAAEMAGELIGMQAGLGFASFFDPVNASFTPVLAQFLGMLAVLAFLALDGHLYLIATLAESFHAFPISAALPNREGVHLLALWGGSLFAFSLQIALPLLGALLIVNLALGILTRSAPQLHLFAIGFPITMGVGFIGLILSMGYFAPLLDQFTHAGMEQALKVMTQLGKH
jgi:flagellar biosynthetic protein FliR